MPPIHTMSAHASPHNHEHSHAHATESRLDGIARMILVALFTILPFFFFPVAWLTSLQSKMLVGSVLLGIVAVLWVVARLMEGGGRTPWNMILGASVFLPIVYALSAAVNGFASVSLVGTGVEADTLGVICLEFAALALTAIVFGSIRNTNGAIRGLFSGILALQVIHLIHIAVPSLSLGGVLGGETGNAMGTWHEFTMLMGLALVSSIALMRSSVAEGMWRWVIAAAGILAVPVLVINNFGDVWIAVGVASVVLFLVRWYQSRSAVSVSFARTEWVLVATLIVSIACAVFGAKIVAKLPESISVVQVEVRPSWQGTFQIGQQSMSNAKSLVFGVGPNTFTRQWGLFKPIEVNQTPFWNADFNVGVAPIPTSFISVGIIGALAWLAFIISVLWTSITVWLRRRDEALSARVLALSVAAVFLLAFHLSSVPGTAIGILMFLVIGLFIASITPAYAHEKTLTIRAGNWKQIAKVSAAGLVSLVAVISSIGIFRAVLADAMINRAIVSYNSTQDLQKSTDLIAMSLKIQPTNDRAHRAAVELGLLKLQQLINAKDQNQEEAKTKLQATLEDTIKHGLEAVQVDGRDYQNWLQLASLYSQLAGAQIQGAYENARAAYTRAQQENPTSPLPLLNLGQLDALEGNMDAALENLGKAVALKPDLASAYYLASQIYVAKQDANNALLAAAQAARYAPNDPLAWYNAGAIAFAAGDYQDAGIAMQQALALQPQYANAMYILGLSLYQLKDVQNALVVFNALDQLDPGQPIVQQIITNLKAGRPLETPINAAPEQEVKAPAKKK